ncbi:MAG: hypothetical protein Q8R92_03465 [Deltaproteobacteria bacterium]|nr:hypothetical protein [Deltaproteobacteria bacterium]
MDGVQPEYCDGVQPEYCDGGRPGCSLCASVAYSAAAAANYGAEAVEAAERGDWDRAAGLCARASLAERDYGDDPVWGPVSDLAERLASEALAAEAVEDDEE